MVLFPATSELNEMQEGVWGLVLVAPWSKARVLRQQQLRKPVVCSDQDGILYFLIELH